MKKLLLVTTALVGVAMMSSPASAAVKLGMGGYFSTYGVYADNNEPAGVSLRTSDWRVDRELFVLGSTTLDNGLTVGVNYEMDLGGAVLTDEAYMYFSGGWGRLNIGAEDGAAFLLQVAAPAADANIDGMQVTMQGVGTTDGVFDFTGAVTGAANALGLKTSNLLDYEHQSSANGLNSADRLTYLTPKFSGFQAGVSYAPQDVQAQGEFNNIQPMAVDNTPGVHDQVWEGALRWDGEFQGFGIALGGGYSHAALQADAAGAGGGVKPALLGAADASGTWLTDGLTTWSGGLNLAWSGFSLGGNYMRQSTENINGVDVGSTGNVIDRVDTIDVTQDTWDVGLGYDNGPWHVGGSYLNTNIQRDASGAFGVDDGAIRAIDATAERWTVGTGYTFGPGMTFNGSVAWGQYDNSTPTSVSGAAGVVDKVAGRLPGLFAGTAATNNDFTQVTVGTNIQF